MEDGRAAKFNCEDFIDMSESDSEEETAREIEAITTEAEKEKSLTALEAVEAQHHALAQAIPPYTLQHKLMEPKTLYSQPSTPNKLTLASVGRT